MVLIAASIFSKAGKPLISRQFVEMTRARVEGLLDAFPKLVGTGKDSANRQHTFVETDSVRYVFHPLDNIYMVLLTTKASNILEDLETLRLFTRVIPEYCRSNEEKEILSKSFELISAFDEIVSLGYRESVNLAQIRTFTDMDSHEERVFLQIKSAQEKAAKEQMELKAKEFKRAQKEALSKGLKPSMSGFSSATSISSSSTPLTAVSSPSQPSAPASSRTGGGGKALKLGAKGGKDDDSFIRQLRQEGQVVASVEKGAGGASIRAGQAQEQALKREPVHIRSEERLVAEVSRDGGLKSAELFGTVSLSVATPDFNTVSMQMHNNSAQYDDLSVQIQVHPNMDKAEWAATSLLKLKSANKPFPVNNDVGVLKWRASLPDEDSLPIVLNVWPQEAPDGCQVNIEYTLQRDGMALQDVVVTVPLPTSTTPVVAECEGSYEYQKSRNQLIWTIPVIDSSNSTGTLEFVTPNGAADHFFPVSVRFTATSLLVDIGVDEVLKMDGSATVPYSSITHFHVEKYDIV